jgi:hypothetical protein
MLKRTAVIAAALAFAASCASTINVRSDYNRQANFSHYRSFSIREGHSSGDPVMDQRIKADVESALRAKGLEEVRSDEGDAIVVAHAATRTEHTYETFYNGWGWRWRWGAPEVIANQFDVGTIVVDMFDASTKTAVWHGYASHVLSEKPAKNDQRADEAVTKIFEKFPTAS